MIANASGNVVAFTNVSRLNVVLVADEHIDTYLTRFSALQRSGNLRTRELQNMPVPIEHLRRQNTVRSPINIIELQRAPVSFSNGHSGILSCFFHGFSACLFFRLARARINRRRVPCGMITSSM